MPASRKNRLAESAICSLPGLRVFTTTGLPWRNFSATEFIFRKSTAAAAKSRNAFGVIRSINVVAMPCLDPYFGRSFASFDGFDHDSFKACPRSHRNCFSHLHYAQFGFRAALF